MKVLHLNTVTGGGSAKGSMRMHKALLQHGVDSWMMTLEEYAEEEPNHKVYQQYFKGLLDKVKFKIKQRKYYAKYRYIKERKNTGVTFSFPETYYDITQHPLYKEADIIHLHWVARWLDYPSFFAKCDKPIVWTIRDRAVFSSGFHVGIEDDSFVEEASDFPENMKAFAEYRFLKENLAIKKDALNRFPKGKILIAPKSKWMAEHAKKSEVLKALNHELITNCIDPSEIYRKDKVESRKALGLPLEKKLVLFVSSGLHVPYKGFQYLEPIIKDQLLGEGVEFVAVGQGDIQFENCRLLGRINDVEKLLEVYSAVDVFVIPSTEDNFPNTLLEALFTGLPSVGFKIGGVQDMIVDGVNGYLAKEISASALQECIQQLLEQPLDAQSIIEDAKSKWSVDVVAPKLIAAYKRLLNN